MTRKDFLRALLSTVKWVLIFLVLFFILYILVGFCRAVIHPDPISMRMVFSTGKLIPLLLCLLAGFSVAGWVWHARFRGKLIWPVLFQLPVLALSFWLVHLQLPVLRLKETSLLYDLSKTTVLPGLKPGQFCEVGEYRLYLSESGGRKGLWKACRIYDPVLNGTSPSLTTADSCQISLNEQFGKLIIRLYSGTMLGEETESVPGRGKHQTSRIDFDTLVKVMELRAPGSGWEETEKLLGSGCQYLTTPRLYRLLDSLTREEADLRLRNPAFAADDDLLQKELDSLTGLSPGSQTHPTKKPADLNVVTRMNEIRRMRVEKKLNDDKIGREEKKQGRWRFEIWQRWNNSLAPVTILLFMVVVSIRLPHWREGKLSLLFILPLAAGTIIPGLLSLLVKENQPPAMAFAPVFCWLPGYLIALLSPRHARQRMTIGKSKEHSGQILP
jgi:hypothetical protein